MNEKCILEMDDRPKRREGIKKMLDRMLSMNENGFSENIELINFVKCPIMNMTIDIAYCIELRMIVDEEVKPTEKEKHLTSKDYEKCKQCEMRRKMKD